MTETLRVFSSGGGVQSTAVGKDEAWFSSALAPLPAVLNQGDLFAQEITCDAGSCFT